MKRTLRVMVTLAVVACFCSLLTGCGGKSESDAKPADTPATTSNAPASNPSAGSTAAPAAGAQGTGASRRVVDQARQDTTP